MQSPPRLSFSHSCSAWGSCASHRLMEVSPSLGSTILHLQPGGVARRFAKSSLQQHDTVSACVLKLLLCGSLLCYLQQYHGKGHLQQNSRRGSVSRPVSNAFESLCAGAPTHLGRWSGNMMHRHDQLLLLGSAGHGSSCS